jgi:hypothetical protein
MQLRYRDVIRSEMTCRCAARGRAEMLPEMVLRSPWAVQCCSDFASWTDAARLKYAAVRMLARTWGMGASALTFVLFIESTGRAHIDLLSPEPRASGSGNAYLDRPPCGQRASGRTLDKVSTFRPGETISVSWDAYVRHPSYFRLSFDPNGDDSFSQRASAPVDPARDDPARLPQGEGELILDYVLDRAGELSQVEHLVTLPSEPCEPCTLQLTQFIYDVPIEEATYYQCADVVLAGDPIAAPAADAELGAAPRAAGCVLSGSPTRRSPWPPLTAALAGLIYLFRRRVKRERLDVSCTPNASRLKPSHSVAMSTTTSSQPSLCTTSRPPVMDQESEG